MTKTKSVMLDDIDTRSNIVVRGVRVDRARTPQQVLEATERKQYVDDKVVTTMPKGEGEEVDVIFFKLDQRISDDGLEKVYAARGLKPADPYSLAAVNEADPAFSNEHPNCAHWKNAKGQYCFATFHCWVFERCVRVYQNDNEWGDSWWFAGIRK